MAEKDIEIVEIISSSEEEEAVPKPKPKIKPKTKKINSKDSAIETKDSSRNV